VTALFPNVCFNDVPVDSSGTLSVELEIGGNPDQIFAGETDITVSPKGNSSKFKVDLTVTPAYN
jgi:hypothetical protein